MRLKNKVVVITGAAAGMGKAMALKFAAEGAKLVLGDLNEGQLNEVISDISVDGSQAVGVVGNIAKQTDAELLISTAIQQFGRIDVLINNAGVLDKFQGVGEVSDEIWERLISINLNGPMYTSRKAVQAMLEQGVGSIINISSTAGVSGASAGVAYTAAKHGVIGMTRSTAWIYAQKGIRCNAILPGGTKTALMESFDPSKLDPLGYERIGAFLNIMPGLLEASHIADLAVFLASDDSRMVNGAIIPADMGWLAS